jgi:hypothetical protein
MSHEVRLSMPTREIGRADVRFQIRRNDQLLGTLAISNGSLVWFPRDTTYGHKMSWSEFDEVMRKSGIAKEKRRIRAGA